MIYSTGEKITSRINFRKHSHNLSVLSEKREIIFLVLLGGRVMFSGEAVGGSEPRRHYNRYIRKKRVKKSGKEYYWLGCILLFMILFLCLSNIMLLKKYRDLPGRTDNEVKAANTISTNYGKLSDSVILLQKENDGLKDSIKVIEIQNTDLEYKFNEIKIKNDELVKKNRELMEDNIALQNSLKKAAAVGIKPQNYTSFNGIVNRGVIERGSFAGKFLGTAYTPSKAECGNNKGITNSGKPIIPGISVAVDLKHWPMGTVFYIKGLGYAVAMDTGSAIKGRNRFDFAVFDRSFAKLLGSRYWDVYLVRLGDGYVRNIKF